MSKKDSELKSLSDYDSLSCQAALQCLLEVADLFDEKGIEYLVVGGWVPSIYFPGEQHIGSVDADFLLKYSPTKENIEGSPLQKAFLEAGFHLHPDAAKWFSFQKNYQIGGQNFAVDVDLLTEKYGGSSPQHKGNRIQGKKALKITGGDYAFRFPAKKIYVDSKTINVVDLLPFILMKSLAMGDTKRNKPKDAYDICFVLEHCDYSKIAGQFQSELREKKNRPESLIWQSKAILDHFFDSDLGKGPEQILVFYPDLSPEEKDQLRQRAYQRVHRLTEI